jgi:hypothetical protein
LTYLAALADGVPLTRWKRIVSRAVEAAEQGDHKARLWISEYILGRQPVSLATLAAVELAGTMAEETEVRAAELRTNVAMRKLRSRASQYPDLNPGRPAGRGNVAGGSPDPHTDLDAREPGRNGHRR